MGLFDKLFGKGKKDKQGEQIAFENKDNNDSAEASDKAAEAIADETVKEAVKEEELAASEPVVSADVTSADVASADVKKNGEKVTAAVEMFPVKKDSVTAQRSSEICTRFINNALSMGEELKASDLQGLNYNELCLLYNNLQIMSLRLEPRIKAIAEVVIKNNAKVIRTRLISELKKQTLYVLYTKVNKLPFASNAAFYIFTQKELAEKQLSESDIMYLALKEIPSEQLEGHFDVFYITGFKDVIIDLGTKIPFSDLYTPKKEAAYGLINPVLCGKMIFFNQMTATFADKAKAENRSITDEENRQVNRIWMDITEGLIRSTLLLPADKAEDGKIMLKGVSVKSPEGKNWIAMFTDQVALNSFFKSNTGAAGIKNPVLSQYAAIKDKKEIEGIIINPARESFRIPSRLLAARRELKDTENNTSATENNE